MSVKEHFGLPDDFDKNKFFADFAGLSDDVLDSIVATTLTTPDIPATIRLMDPQAANKAKIAYIKQLTAYISNNMPGTSIENIELYIHLLLEEIQAAAKDLKGCQDGGKNGG